MSQFSGFSSSTIVIGSGVHARLAGWAMVLVTTLLFASAVLAKSPAPAVMLAKCTGIDACGGINPNLVGEGSCNGDYSCYVATGPIGPGSCNGAYACYATSYPVGDNACIGTRACYRYVSGLLAVASNSCNGNFACEETRGSVGADSCAGEYSCFRAGGSIGLGSCNASSACEITAGSVGDLSCNGSLACYFATSSIGNCQFNTVPPAACVVIDAVFADGFEN